MTIVSSVAFEDAHLQRDGRKYIRFEFTDHLGKVYTHFRYSKYAGNADAEALRVQFETELEDALDRQEQRDVVTAEDQIALIENLQHTTQTKVFRYILRRLIEERDIEFAIMVKPILDYAEANYTPAQLRNASGLTNAQLTKLRNKVDVAATYATAKVTAEAAIEANSEEIE